MAHRSQRGKIKAMPEGELNEATGGEMAKARIRARVEHPFRVVKRQFGYEMVRFKGLAKNPARVVTLFALSNLWMVRKIGLAMTAEARPQIAG